MHTRKIFTIFCATLIALSCLAKKPDTPKYIFLFIGDGMSINGISATENYMAWKEGKHYNGPRLAMRTLPVMGMVDTYAANGCVTCSSAAGTAIACGQKTKCGYEGVDTAGNAINSIAVTLHERGYNIGILTNEPINHATPAAFYAHEKKRSHYGVMSKQLPLTGFEIYAGDGFILDKHQEFKDFDPVKYVQEQGYKVCYGTEQLKACPKGEKVCFFQPSSRLAESSIDAAADENKTYNIEAAVEGDMTVQEMLENSLERLGDQKPFFIMCECGDIDHAAHVNFTMYTIHEIIELDKAVQSALEFYKKHPKETLIVITSDHETGGMCLGGVKHDGDGNWVDWASLEEDWNRNRSRGFNEREKCRELSNKANISWATYHHNGGNVPVFAIGKHSERFSNAMDNTQFVEKIL